VAFWAQMDLFMSEKKYNNNELFVILFLFKNEFSCVLNGALG